MKWLNRIVPLGILLSLLVAMPVRSAEAGECERCRFFLVTMFPGESLFSGFGHTAVRILDPETGEDWVYDYGTYEADDPHLGWKFLTGTLPYYCQALEYDAMMNWYSGDFGGIQLQELNLTPGQKDRVYRKLNFDALPENAAYHYHHFYNNCSTKLRDLFDEVLGGELSQRTRNMGAGKSLRDLINLSMARPEFAPSRWLVFGLLNWTIDAETDRWNQMFLPWYLSREMEGLVQTSLPGRPPLVMSTEVVHGQALPEPKAPRNWPGALALALIALLAGLPGVLAKRGLRRTGKVLLGITLLLYGVGAGFYGSLLLFSWPCSPYPDTYATLTLLVFHPLHWFLVAGAIWIWRDSARGVRWLRRYLSFGMWWSLSVLAAEFIGLIPQRVWPYALATLVASAGLRFSVDALNRTPDDDGGRPS